VGLESLSRSRTAAYRDVQRAKALLMACDGFATTRVAAGIGVSPATVARWRESFERDGSTGSVKVQPGRGGKPSISPARIEEIVHATLPETPPGETHWSCRSMAARTGSRTARSRRSGSLAGRDRIAWRPSSCPPDGATVVATTPDLQPRLTTRKPR
jgi:transposase